MLRRCVLCGQYLDGNGTCPDPNGKNHYRESVRSGDSASTGRPNIHLVDRMPDENLPREQEAESTSPIPPFDEEDWDTPEEETEEEPTEESEPVEEETQVVKTLFLVDRSRKVAHRVREELTGYGHIFTIMVSVLLSAVGTLIFSAMHLEDWFSRWVITGILVPVAAYVAGMVFVWILTGLATEGATEARLQPARVLASAARLPNRLLVLTCLLSPLDQTMTVFQFFALLLTVAWVVCLSYEAMRSLLQSTSAEGTAPLASGMGSKLVPVVVIAFAFLALVSFRAIWVWYLTGEFQMTFHLPLSIFF